MPSQDKLIKQGLKYTDSLFEEISKRLEQGVKASDTLEAFLDKYNKAFPDNGNPLISLNYDSEMLKLILTETNNHKFSRPAQKELVRVTIEDQVGELITRVGDDIKDSVRDIVKEGYNNNLSQDEIAANISDRVSTIKGKRARAIARTEIARTATVSDYVINKERGATHFYVECRNTACPVCKANWLKNPDKEATGKGLMGDRTYSMNDTAMLPPVHPNCRCVAYFVNKEGDAVEPGTSTNQEPTKEQLRQNLTPAERTKYANYKRLVDSHTKWLRDNPDADAKAIENHKRKLATAQANLNELRVKALGGADNVSKPKPITPKPKPKPDANETLPTPTTKQLKENLTPNELRRYKRYQKEIKEGKLSPKFIEQRKKDLADLQRKALGLKPLNTAKPKPQKPKTETKPKTPKEPKKPKPEKEPKTTQTPTREQLDKNLTQKERKDYKDIEYEIKWANDILNNSSSTNNQKTYAQKRLDAIIPRFKELTNKALGLTPKQTSKKTKTKKKSKKKEKQLVELNKPKNARLTKEECDSLTYEQLAEHHNAKYKGLIKSDADNKEYHVFEQTFDNGKTFQLYFEKSAVNSYKKGEVVTANEIIHEVFKVPKHLRKETNEIWFKNTQKGIRLKPNGKLDTIGKETGGYNVSRNRSLRRSIVQDQSTKFKGYDDPNHRIVINPKSFKKLKDFYDIITWRDTGDSITSWKHIIHHEFMHSIQNSRKIWRDGLKELHQRDDYRSIDKEENYFTRYANKMVSESFAEHGGYISYMLANPEEQSKKISIHHYGRDENNKVVSIDEKIDFEEYKKRYPKHYKYFMNLIDNGGGKYETK